MVWQRHKEEGRRCDHGVPAEKKNAALADSKKEGRKSGGIRDGGSGGVCVLKGEGLNDVPFETSSRGKGGGVIARRIRGNGLTLLGGGDQGSFGGGRSKLVWEKQNLGAPEGPKKRVRTFLSPRMPDSVVGGGGILGPLGGKKG